MPFTQSELNLINQYVSDSKENTIKDFKTILPYMKFQSDTDMINNIIRKLDAMPEQECVDFMRGVRAEFTKRNEESIRARLAKAKAEVASETALIKGQDLYDPDRFAMENRYMIVANILTDRSPVGVPGERHRLFLSEIGYQNALESEKRGECKITRHARVKEGNLHYFKPNKSVER